MASEIPETIVRYLEARDRERDANVQRVLGALNERELELVREAAVMGYIQGTMGAGAKIPGDFVIVWCVIAACRAHAELYPTISALAESDSGAHVQ